MIDLLELDTPEDCKKAAEQREVHFKSMGLAYGKRYRGLI